jgi:hypothetical protein
MGNTNSNTCELTEYKNVCEMGKCLDGNIVGLSPNSSSPTDTWIVQFKHGTTYEDKPIKNAFLKMWISNETFKKLNSIENKYIRPLILKNSGLNYEAAVYRHIIKPLIETNICPNFIKFLGTGKDCSFEDVVNMSVGNYNGGTKDEALVKQRTDTVFSTSVIIVNDSEKIMKRTKITDTYPTEVVKRLEGSVSRKLVEDKFTFNIIANEVVKPGTVSLDDFLKNIRINNSTKSRVIFQALAACYAMSCSKMCHNDLHLGNVYIEPLMTNATVAGPNGWSRRVSRKTGDPYYYNETTQETSSVHPGGKLTRMNYIYGGDLYTFETNYIAKVFDFDRSYVKRFGNNPMLAPPNEEWVCEENSQCNRQIENLDALKLMGGIYRTLHTTHEDELLHICTHIDGAETETKVYKENLKTIFDEGTFLTKDGFPITDDQYLEFNTTVDIMKNLSKSSYSHGSIESTYPVGYIPDPFYTFICNTDIFNKQGKITNLNISNGISDKTTIDELRKKVNKLKMENDVLAEALVSQQTSPSSPPPLLTQFTPSSDEGLDDSDDESSSDDSDDESSSDDSDDESSSDDSDAVFDDDESNSDDVFDDDESSSDDSRNQDREITGYDY